LLLAAARPPFDVGLLALVALVPLFGAWRTATPKGAAALGFCSGAVYYGVVVSWAWYFGAVAIVPFVAVLAAYWAAIGATVAWLAHRPGAHPLSAWLFAAVWVVGEGLLARWPLGGFSWGEVGYAFHDVATMRALGALGGLPLISFVAVATNAHLAELLARRRSTAATSPAVAPRSPVSALGALAVGVIGWSVLLPAPPARATLRYALLQGNDINRDLTDTELYGELLPRNHFELAAQLDGDFDLIVFPESSFPDAPDAPGPNFPLARWPDDLARIARERNSYVLANGTGDTADGRATNLNVLWAPDGTRVGEYTKRHLVPFGEWVPWRATLERFIDEVDQIPRDFAPGATRGVFRLRDTTIATVICFESMFGMEVRSLVRDGAQILVVSTNNRSYRRSANSEQHLAAAQIRAVETGRPVLQAAISGISAVVDADGAVVARQPLFRNGVLEGTVTTRGGQTPYVRFGEWVLLASLAALLLAAGSRARDRFRGRHSVDSGS
jgi:apolipoprotein N-acyltransferase